MAGLQGIKGLFARGKKQWLYWQPPTPKGGKRPKMVALGTTDLIEGIKRMNKLNVDGAIEREKITGTLKEVLPLYYAAKREDRAATRRSRQVILDAFMNDTGNPKVEKLTAEMIENWRAGLATRSRRRGDPRAKKGRRAAAASAAAASPTLPVVAAGRPLARKLGKAGGTGTAAEVKAKPLSGTTIKTYTITLRAFVNWLLKEGIIQQDPMANLKRQTRVAATRKNEFLPMEDRERVMDQEAEVDVDIILHAGFFEGLRDSEILAMTPDWIWISPEQDRGTISVQETPVIYSDGTHGVWKPKVLHIRTIPMHPRFLACLKKHGLRRPFLVAPHKERWPAHDKNSKRYDAKKSLHAIAKKARVKKLNFHMMRHTFATLLAMSGVPLVEIAALLGDTLAVTEKYYAGYSPGRVNPLEGI